MLIPFLLKNERQREIGSDCIIRLCCSRMSVCDLFQFARVFV